MGPGLEEISAEARATAVQAIDAGGGNPLAIIQSLALAAGSPDVWSMPRIIPYSN